MELCKSNPKLERACHGLFQPDLFISVPAAVSGGVFPLPQRSGEKCGADRLQPDLLRLGRAGLPVSDDRRRGGQLGLRAADRKAAQARVSCAGAGAGPRVPRGLQIYGLRGGKPERAVRRVDPRTSHRAAHRHLVLYLPGAFLHGRRLARGCPGAAVVCKISALHLALPAAHRRADRPLCRRRRADRRAQL